MSRPRRTPPTWFPSGTTWPPGPWRSGYEYVTGARKTWRDGRTQRLEDLLPAVLQGILVTAEMLRTRRLKSERQERERRAAQVRQAELERLRREEEARRQELEQQVNRWVWSQNLREYLQAIEQEALRRGPVMTPEVRLGRLLLWAREHADRLDPIAGVLEHNKEASSNERKPIDDQEPGDDPQGNPRAGRPEAR